MYIGRKIKELRKENRITLSELSENSGVQIATLSRIENLKMVGSLESHLKIAKGLGVDVTVLYKDIIKEDSKIELSNAKAISDVFVHNEKSSYEILTNKILNKRMMPILVKIEADGSTNKEQNQIGSEKFIFVLEGQVEAKIDTESFSLSKNNSLYFESSLEHQIVNVGKSTAKILSISTPVAL